MSDLQNFTDTIAKINELYIITRRKFIGIGKKGYWTHDSDSTGKLRMITDNQLKQHLKGSTTYGVFNGNSVNKFVTFDVDYADNLPMARWATHKLIDVLQRDFNVRHEDIHVSLSGSKGYHVDLFFDKVIPADAARRFYDRVIELAELSDKNVEYRPSYEQAVKLPLGIHQKTGNRCWFVDRETLEPIESFEYLNDVEPMDHAIILDALIELTDDQEAEFREVVKRTDTSVTVVSESGAFRKVLDILDAGQLLRSHTRHETTLLLASFGNSQGFEREETVETIMDILTNTPPDYFNKKSTPEHWRKEAIRLVDRAYDNDYRLGNEDMPITIYRSEIIAILGAGTFRQKQVAYAMLVTSKRYGRTFYLTMNTIMQMIGTKAKATVNTAIQKLVASGFIEYVRKGEIDAARSRQLGRAQFKPNRYRLAISLPQVDEEHVDVMPNQSLVDVTYMLLDQQEVKGIVARREYEGRWA